MGFEPVTFLQSSRAYYFGCLFTYWATRVIHSMIIIYRCIHTNVLPAVLLFFLNELEWMNNGIKLLHLFSIGLYPWRTILLLCEIYMYPNEVRSSLLYHTIHVVTPICTLRNLSIICCGTVVTSEIISVLKMVVRLIICKKATNGQTSML